MNRERSIAHLVQIIGMRREDATIMLDLADHAFNEAMAAVERVANGAPRELRAKIALMAYKQMGLLGRELDQMLEERIGGPEALEAAMKRYNLK